MDPHTLTRATRRSSRNLKPTQHFPHLYYLLLIDSGELKCYDEVMHVETITKWEQSMDEEILSLLSD